jgi:hypothetical protein
MKKPNRQTLLVAGAVICLLISVFALLPSGSGSGDGEPVPSENTAAPPPTEPSDGGANPEPASANAPPLNPEFYQRVRQQLLAVAPEHQEPFVAESSPPPSAREAGGRFAPLTGEVKQGTASLPVLPLTLQPAPSDQESAPHGNPPTPLTLSPLSKGGEGGGEGGFASLTTATNPTNSARLRGRIYDHAKGRTVVLFELNGALLRASNEPNAEWRILRITPRQITVRNGEQTLILEVPYAR